MKAKTFENLIRRIVREEIDYSIRRELKTLKEDLSNELKPTITEQNQHLAELPKRTEEAKTMREKIMGTKPIKQKPRPIQNFSSNSTLNDLLNETAMGDTNTNTANAPVNMAQPFSSGAPLPAEGMPPEVAKAVTRDYSGLMKAIAKKKGR